MTDRRPRHVVDFHTHAFPEKVAARAAAALAETYGVSPVAEPTIAGLTGAMDEAGVDVSVVLPVATRPDQVRSINDWAATVTSERIVCFGALHPDLPDPAAELTRAVDLGLKGINLQPNFQRFSPDDERLEPAYRAAEGKLVVAFHCGQEIAPCEEVYARPAAVARVHQKHPALDILVAHMGGYQMWEEARSRLVGSGVYLDMSYCPEDQLSDDDVVGLMRAHGVQRVLFATDFPWASPRDDVARLCRLRLDQGELEAVAWMNARDLLGLKLD